MTAKELENIRKKYRYIKASLHKLWPSPHQESIEYHAMQRLYESHMAFEAADKCVEEFKK